MKISITSRDIDKIQDIMDDVAEQLQVSNEMSDLISSPMGGMVNHYKFSVCFNCHSVCWNRVEFAEF